MTTFGTLTEHGEVINKIEVDLHEVPSSDPICFMYGVKQGQDRLRLKQESKSPTFVGYLRPVNHGSKWSDLDPEYLRGFLFGYMQILVPEGTKFRKGNEQNYALLHLKINK